MILEEFIEENLQTDKCKLVDAIFYEKKNTLEINLLCIKNYLLDDKRQKELKNAVAKFIGIKDLIIELNVKQNLLDTTILKMSLINYFKENAPSILNLCKFEDLSYTKQDDECDVSFSMPSDAFALKDKISAENELQNVLHKEFFYDFKIEIKENAIKMDTLDSILKKNDNFCEELIELREYAKPTFETYEFFKSTDFIGEITEKEAVRIDCIKNFDGEFVLAGKIKNANKITYIPKNVKEGETPIEKVRLVFNLQDYWGEINCVYFPNQQTIEKLDDLVDDLEIAVLGEKNEFNGSVSFKVKAIAGIIMPDKMEEEREYRNAYDNYLVAKPFPYEENSQMNLMDLGAVNKISDKLENNDFVVYDFETTGLSPETCQVIEIGAVKIHKGKITEIFSTLIKADEPLPEVIIKVTNITDEMLVDAPCYELAFADFYKFCQNSILVGYNNLGFDTNFLKKAWNSIGFKFDFEEEDAFIMAKKKMRLHNYKLGTVVKALDIELINAHRAYADATATAKAYLKLLDM